MNDSLDGQNTAVRAVKHDKAVKWPLSYDAVKSGKFRVYEPPWPTEAGTARDFLKGGLQCRFVAVGDIGIRLPQLPGELEGDVLRCQIRDLDAQTH